MTDTSDLEKLGGLENALTTVLNEDKEDVVRETAALAIATASRKDDAVCCELLSREVRGFRKIIELLWDDNTVVAKNCLRMLCNCTFVDLEAPSSKQHSLRALMGRFLQETDWVSSLISLIKSDPLARKNRGSVVMALNSIANLSLEFVPVKAAIAKHGSIALFTNALRTRTPPDVLEAALNALINCLDSLPKSIKMFHDACGFTRVKALFQAYLDSLCASQNSPSSKKRSPQQPPGDLVLFLLYQCFSQGDSALCRDIEELGLIQLLASSLRPNFPGRLPVRIRNLILKCILHFLDRLKSLSKGTSSAAGPPSHATQARPASGLRPQALEQSVLQLSLQGTSHGRAPAVLQQLWESDFVASAHEIMGDPASASGKTDKDGIVEVVKKILLHLRTGFGSQEADLQGFMLFLMYGGVDFLITGVKQMLELENRLSVADTHNQAAESSGTSSTKLKLLAATSSAAKVILDAHVENACFMDDTLQWMQSRVKSPAVASAVTSFMLQLAPETSVPTQSARGSSHDTLPNSSKGIHQMITVLFGLVQLCCYRSPQFDATRDVQGAISRAIADRNGSSAGCSRALGRYLSKGVLDPVLGLFDTMTSSTTPGHVSWEETAASLARKAGKVIGGTDAKSGCSVEQSFYRFVSELSKIQQAVVDAGENGDENAEVGTVTAITPLNSGTPTSDDEVTFVVHPIHSNFSTSMLDSQYTPQLAKSLSPLNNSPGEARYFTAHRDRFKGHGFFKELLLHAEPGLGHVHIRGVSYAAFCGVVAFIYEGSFERAVQVAWDNRAGDEGAWKPSILRTYFSLFQAAKQLGCPRLQRFCWGRLSDAQLLKKCPQYDGVLEVLVGDSLAIAAQPNMLPVSTHFFSFINCDMANTSRFVHWVRCLTDMQRRYLLVALGVVAAQIIRRTWI